MVLLAMASSKPASVLNGRWHDDICRENRFGVACPAPHMAKKLDRLEHRPQLS